MHYVIGLIVILVSMYLLQLKQWLVIGLKKNMAYSLIFAQGYPLPLGGGGIALFLFFY